MYTNFTTPAANEFFKTTPYALRHQLLRLACIPISPLAQIYIEDSVPILLCKVKKFIDNALCFIDKGTKIQYSPRIHMRVILVHGFNANPAMNFHPWLADQLRDRKFDVVMPELPLSTKEEFNLPEIIEKMKQEVGYLKSDDILLGHSLGAFIILQYLEAIEMTQTPRAVILVAAPWNVSRPELRRLFFVDLDADVLMWKAREFVVVHSKDDQLVPYEHGERLATQLKARLVTTESDGHFMNDQYPILLETIEEIARRPFEFEPGMSLKDDYTDIQTLS